jgi:hypothetical protein
MTSGPGNYDSFRIRRRIAMILPPVTQPQSNGLIKHQLWCPGAIVAIVGPDGTGKSTTIDEIRKQLASNGSEVSRITRHWRPGLLPALGRLTGKDEVESRLGEAPRRSPGRFHFLRLAYYGLDFIAGYFLKDNLEKQQNKVILYDRCALDMQVDPVRYALKSAWGTRLLCKVSPKPDAIVLLYDSASRILARKAELSSLELQRQFAAWIKLLADEQVDALVRINSDAAAIGLRIASFLDEGEPREKGNSEDSSARRRMLECVCRMLTVNPQPVESKILSEQDSSSAHETIFAVVPSLSAPRFLIPLGNRKAAANSLRAYSAHKLIARASKWVLTKSLTMGLAQPFLRQRVVIRNFDRKSESLEHTLSIEQHLARELGRSEIFLGVSLGTPGAHQKPLFQVMDREGRALAYAKIGWNEATIRNVQNEAQALQKLSQAKFTKASIPRVLLAEYWNDYYLLLQSGPTSEDWVPSRDLSAKHLQMLAELNEIDHISVPLQESIWWKSIEERIKTLDEMGAAYDADLVRWTLDECAINFGETEVSFGMKHGDFAPWNLLEKKEELFVLDWEYADNHAPLGSDLFHFVIQRAALVSEARPKDIARDLMGSTPVNWKVCQYFAAAGIERALIHSYLVLYVADTLSWHMCRDQGIKDAKSSRTRDIWRYLLACYVCRVEVAGASPHMSNSGENTVAASGIGAASKR